MQISVIFGLLLCFGPLSLRGEPESRFGPVACEGKYRHHLQGVCTDDSGCLYWSFTTTLVKTDNKGKVLKKVEVANHHGDLCFNQDKLYVAVNLGRFNDPEGKADSWIYVYDSKDLTFTRKHKTPQVFHGAGGIAYHNKRFVVVGGLPSGVEENYAYEYDTNFEFVTKHTIESGNTLMGIQTATFHDGHWWFGCYGNPKVLLKSDDRFRLVGKYEFDCSLGIVGIGKGRFLVGNGGGSGEDRTGSVLLAESDEKNGMIVNQSKQRTAP